MTDRRASSIVIISIVIYISIFYIMVSTLTATQILDNILISYYKLRPIRRDEQNLVCFLTLVVSLYYGQISALCESRV